MVVVYILCALIFGGPSAVSAVSVTVDAQASVIRREGVGAIHINEDGEAIHVSAEGEMVNLKDQPRAEATDPACTSYPTTETCPEVRCKWIGECLPEDWSCHVDYPKGLKLTSSCNTSDDAFIHENIISQSVCRDAAKEAGAEAHEFDFIITEKEYMQKPWGCFAEKCKKSDKTCYYYNGSPLTPNDIKSGTPVCKRPRFANGTATPNDVQNGCPKGYQAIMHENTCRDAGICQGMKIGADFRVGEKNASEHHDHPIGCFLNPYDKHVYFNFVEEGFETPSDPSGVPMCNVSSTTAW